MPKDTSFSLAVIHTTVIVLNLLCSSLRSFHHHLHQLTTFGCGPVAASSAITWLTTGSFSMRAARARVSAFALHFLERD